MTEMEIELDAPIGRRSPPRLPSQIPASGVAWTGSREFIVKQEIPGVYRWIMVSGDHQFQLARSASHFSSPEACRQEIKRIDPTAKIS
jgi:hypothetical protein